jgi:UDPglucose--hexose-1-phosphate uridylyltransferase
VVPNKYPALRPDASELEGLGPLFDRRGGQGHHEVIIEGEEHTRSVGELSSDRMQEVVSVYRERFRALSTVSGLESAVLIKNVGVEAGASIEHSHSQLIATPLLPPTLELEMRSAAEWSRQGRGCIWCSIIQEERARQERVVFDEGGLIALCPWASRFPYETWILPRTHASHFERASDADVVELAACIQRLVNAVEACLREPPYNYVVHSAPFPTRERLDYHWRLSLLPRITHAAGYEQATGLYINPLLPEVAAADLRSRWVGAKGLEPGGR